MYTLILTAVLLQALSANADITVYHRFYHPLSPETPFTPRGSMQFGQKDTVTIIPSESFSQELAAFSEPFKSLRNTHDRAMYQVALQRDDRQWGVSSTKACLLQDSTSETIVLHVIEAGSRQPYALDYFVAPVPYDGACPEPVETTSLFGNVARLNTSISLRPSRLAPLPELRGPPPLSPTGEQVQPAAEKSFLQKYWMYIAMALVALLLAGGAPPEEGKEGGSQ